MGRHAVKINQSFSCQISYPSFVRWFDSSRSNVSLSLTRPLFLLFWDPTPDCPWKHLIFLLDGLKNKQTPPTPSSKVVMAGLLARHLRHPLKECRRNWAIFGTFTERLASYGIRMLTRPSVTSQYRSAFSLILDIIVSVNLSLCLPFSVPVSVSLSLSLTIFLSHSD